MATMNICDGCNNPIRPNDDWALINGSFERDGLRITGIEPEFRMKMYLYDEDKTRMRIDLCLPCIVKLLQS